MTACPICHEDMAQQQDEGVTVDVCAKHGVWLDQKELLIITERKRFEEGSFVFKDLIRHEEKPPVDPDRKLACPKCGKDMRIETYKEVGMDWCPDHGVWLDSGELEAIENNLRLDPVFLRGVALRLSELEY